MNLRRFMHSTSVRSTDKTRPLFLLVRYSGSRNYDLVAAWFELNATFKSVLSSAQLALHHMQRKPMHTYTNQLTGIL